MGKVFDQIIMMENALDAFRLIRKGHSEDYSMLKFESNLMANIQTIVGSIKDGTYSVKGYRILVVREPKERNIYAPYIEDRLVQQMIYSVIEPFLDRKMDHYSGACRIGKGVEFSRKSTQRMMRHRDSIWYVKLDIDKFFASIDHDVLKSILAKHIRDKAVLELLECFIGNGFGDKGIPIGNLLSQLFANLYLNELDQFVRHDTKAVHYVRYMDDFICFAKDKASARELKIEAIRFVNEQLKLNIDNRKVKLQKVKHGITFLGCKIKAKKMFLSKTKIKKIRHRIKRYIQSGCSTPMQHSFANIVPEDDTFVLAKIFQVYNEFAGRGEKLLMLKACSKKFNVFMSGQYLFIGGAKKLSKIKEVTL